MNFPLNLCYLKSVTINFSNGDIEPTINTLIIQHIFSYDTALLAMLQKLSGRGVHGGKVGMTIALD